MYNGVEKLSDYWEITTKSFNGRKGIGLYRPVAMSSQYTERP